MCATARWKQFCLQWRLWVHPIMMSCYAIFVVIVVPVLIVNSLKDGFSRKDQLILVGGLFVLTAIPFSVYHICQHIVHFTKPILQKHIIRILWMVPIYALNAWLGLIFPEHSIYMDSFRECYEAYVIYNFMVYLLNYLNLEMDLEATLELQPPVPHIFPLCCLTPWEMGREFVHNCKHGILQYVVIRPLTTFISVICELCGVYGESSISGDVAFPYIMAVNNVSQFVAMYCLVLFYQANKVELRPMRPIPKFLCIKAVIFFSFFQGVIITFLVYFGYIKNIFGSEEGSDNNILASKLQDFLICIEMFLAAIAHQYSFPHKPFHINIPHYESNTDLFSAFLSMFNMSDIQQDVSEHFGVVGSSLSRRLRGRSAYHMARGSSSGGASTSEADYLIQPNNVPVVPQHCYQSGQPYTGNVNAVTNTATAKNRYGAFDASSGTNSIAPSKYQGDGINIVKQSTTSKDYSPQYGAPKMSGNFFLPSNSVSSNSTRNEKSTSENTTSTKSGETFTGLTTGGGGAIGGIIRKSDSTTSDWLSTPTDEMLGIDVKGLEKDRIIYNTSDPRT